MSTFLSKLPSARPCLIASIPGNHVDMGAKNIMIGAVVTGMEVSGIEKMTREFRQALDA